MNPPVSNTPETEQPLSTQKRRGPATPEGMAASSMNALKHGLRSDKTLLPEEDPEEFAALMNQWFEQYAPATHSATVLVTKAGRAEWFLRRAENMLEQIVFHLPLHPFDWNDAHHASFEKFSRYKTTAERSFLRYYKELEAHYGRIASDAEAQFKRSVKIAALELKAATRKEEKAAADMKVTQFVTVESIDGKAQTSCYPSNGELAEQIAARPEPPLYVKRWIEFTVGIPEEYAWADPAGLQAATPALGIQRMSYRTWLRLIEREKASGSGHISPLSPLSFI